MAVQKIDYENKIGLQNDENVPNKNKVTDNDMNEIKSKVNNNADELSTAQQNIEDLQSGQGTASGDIASLKNRVTTLEGDNTKNKQDIANKVDKVEGKGLSTEDYTTAEKEKLAGLKNYDDTEIKQDIQEINEDVSDIKSNQTTQNDLLERTQSALINIKTEKSSNINVKDSSDLNAKVDVYGISRQKTRSGKNKANSSAYNYDTVSYQDLDINLENNEFTISTDSLRIITEYIKVPIKISENGTYTFGLELKANKSETTAQALVYDSTNKKIIGSPLQNDTTTYAKKTTTITIDDTVDKSNINVLLYCNGTVGNAYSYSYKNIFVNPGQDDEFEQYGASPTPEYPSEIENVTGDIDITVCNKNLFKILSETNKTYITINNDNTFIINGTIAQNESFVFSRIRLKKGTYTFSLGDYSKITNCYYNIRDLDTAEAIKNFNYADTTVEIDKDRNIELSFVVMAGTYNNVLIKPQVEVENKATSWVEHKEQLITFPLSEGQKLYNGDYPASDGIHHVRKQVVLDGTENWMVSGNSYYLTVAGKKLRYELTKGKMLCTHFKETTTGVAGEVEVGEFFEGYYSTGNRNVFFNYDNGEGGVEGFKSYLSQQKQAGTPVVVEYETEEEKIEPYTEEQQAAYNKLQNVLSYYNVTNVFTDKAQLVFKYIADTQTWTVNLVKSEVANINQQLLELAGGN